MAPKTRKNKIKEVDLIAYWSREMDMTPKQFEALAKEVGQLHQERLDGFHRSFPHAEHQVAAEPQEDDDGVNENRDEESQPEESSDGGDDESGSEAEGEAEDSDGGEEEVSDEAEEVGNDEEKLDVN